MDKLYAMRAFTHIVEAGSITAAAEAMTVSQPALVRTLAALERAVGVRLLNRTTRRMSLTDEGREYYERCRSILIAVDEAHASLNARRIEPLGRLRITASVPFGRSFVAPVVTEFLKTYPRLSVELLLLDRVIDLVEEGVDVAVRLAPLPDSSLVAMPLGRAHRMVVASPDLIARVGTPRVPADLARQPCISFSGLSSPTEWLLGSKPVRVKIQSALVTNQIDAAVLACEQGLGFGQFFDYQVRTSLSQGRLVQVLPKLATKPTPVSLVYPHARMPSANVRAFIDFALPRLRSVLGAGAA